ncbi:cell division protein FtsK, partial [Enterococcus faecium]|nr:cell division protein FtsK [Enterococcus faecium]HAY6986538.1 cell division protein FtsK [Enterococcus faecium]
NKEEKANQGAKSLEKLQQEKLEKLEKALSSSTSETQSSKGIDNGQSITTKNKPKNSNSNLSVNVVITTDKSEKKQVNGTTSPIMQKMIKAKKQVQK